MSIADVKKTAEHKMQRSLEALRLDLAKVRTGVLTQGYSTMFRWSITVRWFR